jgi:hypothetical protein
MENITVSDFFTGISGYWSQIQNVSFYACLISVMTTFLLIYGRYELRIRRLRMIRDYISAFPRTASDKDGLNPSFEFVRSKYTADIRTSAEAEPINQSEVISQIDRSLKAVRFFGNRGDIRLFIGAIGFMIISYFGFHLTFSNLYCTLEGDTLCNAKILENMLFIGGLANMDFGKLPVSALLFSANVSTVASLTFIGAFCIALRRLVRAVSVFDLTAFAFIRYSSEIVISVLVTVVLYRAFPDPAGAIGQVFSFANKASEPVNSGVSTTWILLALCFGLIPESGTQFALMKISSIMSWIKGTDDRFLSWTKVIPLDVIDGIDYFTRFRLEECGISEVQSLATYNPIMLHIETPFGIYQAIDWIAQAQLCCVVGLDRFLMLRQFNIRTIFDLERALKQDKSDNIETDKALDIFDQIYASFLFASNEALRGIETISKSKFLIEKDGAIIEASANEFCLWARTQIGKSGVETASKSVEHVMTWIGDDLHVRRARRLWNEISTALGPNSLTLLTDDAINKAKE